MHRDNGHALGSGPALNGRELRRDELLASGDAHVGDGELGVGMGLRQSSLNSITRITISNGWSLSTADCPVHLVRDTDECTG